MSRFWTRLPGFAGALHLRDWVRQGICYMLCAALLSGCGPIKTFWGEIGDSLPGSEKSPENTAQSPPPKAPEGNDKNISVEMGDTLPALTGPPGADERAPEPGQDKLKRAPDGMPALQPARSVKLESLFVDDIRDPATRIKRAETAILDLRRDFEAILPAIVRLSAVEKDMQELIRQLQTLAQSEPPVRYEPAAAPEPPAAAPSVIAQARPAPKAQPPPAATSPPPIHAGQNGNNDQGRFSGSVSASAGTPARALVSAAPPPAYDAAGTHVKALRLGAHKDKTRLVLDVSAAAPWRHDLDNAENILVIELPGTAWAAPKSWSGKDGLISSWAVHDGENGGSRVVIQLKGPSAIIYSATLPKDAKNDFRIVIDLSSSGS